MQFEAPAAAVRAPEMAGTLPESPPQGWEFRKLTPQEMEMDFVTLVN
jgi:hypothetical protein